MYNASLSYIDTNCNTSTGAHATGLKLNRELKGYSEKNEKQYAKEELIAELSSMLITGNRSKNAIAYLQSWLKHTENSKKDFMNACNKAFEVFELEWGSKKSPLLYFIKK